MRLTHVPALILTATALAACGGSGGGAGTASPAGDTGAGATTTVTHTVTSGGSSSATTAPSTLSQATPGSGGAPVSGGSSSAGPRCLAATLALSYLGGQGATGHGELGFALRNTGSAACATGGYPGIQFLDRDGGALPTVPTHTTSDFFGHTTVRALTLTPGQSASFRLGVTHIPTGAGSCVTAYGLQVIAPNDTATLKVSIPGGASECAGATVSPLQAGDSAFQ